MNTQRRRLNSESAAVGIGTQESVEVLLDEGPSVNVHGLRYCGSVEPENADANANGFWVAFCLPAGVILKTDLPDNFNNLDNEDFLPYLWGVGCWTASNQAPYHFEFAPRTSRTCQNGARILCYIVPTGISAGNVRINQTLTCFTSN